MNERMEQNIENLSILASVILFIFLIGGIIILLTMSTMEDPTGIGTETVANPVGLGLGIGIILSGVIQFFLLNVYCDMARNLLIIRQNAGKTVDSGDEMETLAKEEV